MVSAEAAGVVEAAEAGNIIDMNFESGDRRESLSLKDLFSNEPIHGLGYERFTESEQKDAEAVLARFGVDVEDPVVTEFDGETLMNLMDYVHTPARDTEERNKLVAYIQQNINDAFERMGEDRVDRAA